MISETQTSYIRTTEQLEKEKMKAASEEEALGRDAFLTLFTTQLKNQNPLDPMGNEAFVAQLAQFSQVEGIKGMQSSMEDLVNTIKGEQMFSGAHLVGKKVAVTGGHVISGDGQPIIGSLDLPGGAQGIVFTVNDINNRPVFRSTMGPQAPGKVTLEWSGKDMDGKEVPDGPYTIKANIVDGNSLTAVPVTTFVGVKSVSWRPDTQQINLQIETGDSVAMSDVTQITN